MFSDIILVTIWFSTKPYQTVALFSLCDFCSHLVLYNGLSLCVDCCKIHTHIQLSPLLPLSCYPPHFLCLFSFYIFLSWNIYMCPLLFSLLLLFIASPWHLVFSSSCLLWLPSFEYGCVWRGGPIFFRGLSNLKGVTAMVCQQHGELLLVWTRQVATRVRGLFSVHLSPWSGLGNKA